MEKLSGEGISPPTSDMRTKPVSVEEADIIWGKNYKKFIRSSMLFGDMRQFIIEKFKKPALKVIILLSGRLPEPTKENTTHPNTHILLDIRDRFFELENNPGREALFRGAFKILICEYEHDPYYARRLDWMLEEMIKRGWTPRGQNPGGIWWREFHDYTKDIEKK